MLERTSPLIRSITCKQLRAFSERDTKIRLRGSIVIPLYFPFPVKQKQAVISMRNKAIVTGSVSYEKIDGPLETLGLYGNMAT